MRPENEADTQLLAVEGDGVPDPELVRPVVDLQPQIISSRLADGCACIHQDLWNDMKVSGPGTPTKYEIGDAITQKSVLANVKGVAPCKSELHVVKTSTHTLVLTGVEIGLQETESGHIQTGPDTQQV